MRVSVLLPCYNRGSQLVRTILSYVYCKGDADVELIVVEDGSERPVDIASLKKLAERIAIRYIRFPLPSPRVAFNSTLALNVAAKRATGDVLVLTNAENLIATVGFLHYLPTNSGTYGCGTCYNIVNSGSIRLEAWDWSSPQVIDSLWCIPRFERSIDGHPDGWRAHPVHRGVLFPFWAVIHKSDFMAIGGLPHFFETSKSGWAADAAWGLQVQRFFASDKILWKKEILCLHQPHDEVYEQIRPFQTKCEEMLGQVAASAEFNFNRDCEWGQMPKGAEALL